MNLRVLNQTMENDFDLRLADAGVGPLRGISIGTVQVNIGLTCNLACHHCHVESSPRRTEQMSWETMEWTLAAAGKSGARTIDITGGAPEMNPNFRRFVDAALAGGFVVMVRTNLTIMLEDGYRDLPKFYADRGVHLVASLPCYLETNVDRQRGKHVYQESIEIIRQLNALGYGSDPKLPLYLVYNPGGPSLPPNQAELEAAYRERLGGEFGIRFTHLHTITNVPIGRFLHDLKRDGRAGDYQQLLERNFNLETTAELMCRHQLHVGWDGTIYDCDFNYALGLRAEAAHIRNFDPAAFLVRRIVTGSHCFACTAGCGSSCGGSLVSDAEIACKNSLSVQTNS